MGSLRLLTVLAVVCLGLALRPYAHAVDVQIQTSPGGQEFWLVEEPTIPIVAIEMGFEAGAWLDPEGREGLSSLTMSMMDEGAGDLDAVAFSERADEISARFGFSAGRDGVSVSARFLIETLDESVDLLSLAMTSPRFDAEPLVRVRGQVLSGIAQGLTDPDTIASRAWFARAFPDHPYGRPYSGTAESVSAITVEDMRAMRPRLLARGGVKISIVGAIGPEKAGEIVDRLLAGLPDETPEPTPRAETSPPAGIHVIREDVPQSVAVIGQMGLRRDDPDYMAAFVMNYVLGGGGFTSRLTEEVREKRGLAYSVYSYLSEREGTELYMAGVQTANARIAESIDVIRAEWAHMAEEGVTAEELEAAKTYLTGSFPLRFDSNAKIAGYLVFLQSEGLGPDYLDRRNGLVEAVTQEDIRRVAARLLRPETLSIVVVGQPEGL